MRATHGAEVSVGLPVVASEERLAALRVRGLDTFDPAGARHVEALLTRGNAFGGLARARLAVRAEARLDAIERALVAARADAERRLAPLAVDGGASAPSLHEALERGDFLAVREGARRALRERAAARQLAAVPSLERLRTEARAREVHLSADLERKLGELHAVGGVVPRSIFARARALETALASALFQETLSSVRADLAVAQAADNVPEDAGPYNPHVLAARALRAVGDLSPAYLRALIDGLDDIATVEANAIPEPWKPTKGRAGRSRKAR